MEPSKPLPLVDGYRLNLSCIDSYLHIEAEEVSSKRIFSLKLDSDAITQITNGFFTDTEMMRQALIDAIMKLYPDAQVSIQPGGKIVYTAYLSLGKIKKEYNFSLDLEEKHIESGNPLERKVLSLEAEIERLKQENIRNKEENEKRFREIAQNMMQEFQDKIFQRLEELEKKLNPLQNSITRKEDSEESEKKAQNQDQEEEQKADQKVDQNGVIHFNPSSRNAAYFRISPDNRTISRNNNDAFYPCIEVLPQIPSNGQHKYSLSVRHVREGFLFGITTVLDEINWNRGETNYRYWSKNGLIYPECKTPIGGNFGSLRNVVISMVVDMDQGNLSFFVDDILVNSCKIQTQGNTYYAYVSMSDRKDSVTIV